MSGPVSGQNGASHGLTNGLSRHAMHPDDRASLCDPPFLILTGS